jgi:hypothetical protein
MTVRITKRLAYLEARPSDGATHVGVVLMAQRDADNDPLGAENAPYSATSSGRYDPIVRRRNAAPE